MAENIIQQPIAEYDENDIKHLSDMEHIRLRPGMYIGRLGDGSHAEDGIYVLLKEVIDNSIDEFKMGAGRRIEVDMEDNQCVAVRDYGRGIPLGSLIDAVSMLNTGGKYDSKAFQKSVGLNGVGLKAVNALSQRFEVYAVRDGEMRRATFEKGLLVNDTTRRRKRRTEPMCSLNPTPRSSSTIASRPSSSRPAAQLHLPEHRTDHHVQRPPHPLAQRTCRTCSRTA